MRSLTIVVWVVSVSALACTIRERRPDGPYRQAEEFADALSDEAVDCTREHGPEGSGQIDLDDGRRRLDGSVRGI